VTLNKALGGIASGGGSNGSGYGGGIAHLGALDDPNTLVINNQATTGFLDFY
jgi:hypothetical protein